MKILNTTTGLIEELTHSGYACDCVPDLIVDDSLIVFNREKEIHEADADSIAWWREYLAADADFLTAKADLIKTLDYNEKDDLEILLSDAMRCDLEDQPAAGMRVISEWIADAK